MKKKISSIKENEEIYPFNSKRKKLGTTMNNISKSRVLLKNILNSPINDDEVNKFSLENKNKFLNLKSNFLFEDKYFQIESSTQKFSQDKENYIKNQTSNTDFLKDNENIMANKSKNYKDKQITSIFKQRKTTVKQLDSSKSYQIIANQDNKISSTNNSNIQANKLNILPEILRSIFKIDKFNYIQDQCFEKLYKTNDNIIVSSPTGSGKTSKKKINIALFEIAICKVINENIIQNSVNPNKNFKIIYLAPIKSLCQEKLSDWKIKFGRLNIGVTESTGDTDYIHFPTIFTSNVILTTPEKFDSITRKWKEYSLFISNINLILIDEVHLLNDPTRGATLEAIVARMKLIADLNKKSEKQLRIIALSATIPNIKELAEWIDAESNCLR